LKNRRNPNALEPKYRQTGTWHTETNIRHTELRDTNLHSDVRDADTRQTRAYEAWMAYVQSLQ
jgi:hypothetical protein